MGGGGAVSSGGGFGGVPMFMEEPLQQECIRVCLRLRPINKLEQSRRSRNCITFHGDGQHGLNNGNGVEGREITVDSPLEGEFDFAFDKAFNEKSSQADIYRHAAAPLASEVLEGFNCALIAYGQTGSGKTHTMMGEDHAGTKTTKSLSESGGGGKATDENIGMIHLLIKDIFRHMEESPPTVEYIVRCSFVEIYLEKVLDLLNPVNRSIRILNNGDKTSGEHCMGSIMGGSSGEGVRMDGASEACCFDESDVISLLVRGNACRTVSSTKMNTDSSRSHAIFVMKIEQKDNSTGISKSSQLLMIDMAGSELGKKNRSVGGTVGTAIHQEARMINKSLAALNAVVRTVASNQQASGGGDIGGGLHEVPYRHSKLTRLLKDAFGGNCRTSLILTASPASYNISESIRTMKFGHYCRNVTNFVKPSVEMSPVDYRKLLNDSQKKQGDLIDLVNELSAECFQLKQDAKSHKFVESHYTGPLWETIEAILVNGASTAVGKPGRGRRPSDSNEVAALREELSKARDELENSKKSRESIENMLAERQSEVAVLRTQNDNYCSEKKKNSQELISARNEIRLLTQRKQEVEHNLRTSQFREYEATVFLRQFRRFYRRLLRNKAAQGTGGTSEVIEKVPGVPDLNDLIDVDSLLLESGLIEESELHDDAATGAYRPSAQALGRSTEASGKAWKEAAALGKVDELVALDNSSLEGHRRPPISRAQVGGNKSIDGDVSELADGGASIGASKRSDDGGADAGAGTSVMPYGQSVTQRQQFLGTPAGRLTIQRERELERDLLRATERCIELQVALNEEKANGDILANRAGNLNKKKSAQETIQLKQQLDKKTHDLQAIIWKMNELHLINKTYNEKMSNREQHVTYLEENLVELQSSNRNMILERQEAEEKLREELENLKVLVDAMTIPLWQFGECGITGRTLASRIRLPVRGGEYGDDREKNLDGDESLESLEESAASDEDDDDELDESEHTSVVKVQVPPPPPPVQIITQKNVPMRDASTQTAYSAQEKGTMTDAPMIPQPPPRSTLRDSTNAVNEASPAPRLPREDDTPWQSKLSRDDADSTRSDDSEYPVKAEQTAIVPKSISRVALSTPGDSMVTAGGKPSTINNEDDMMRNSSFSEDLYRGGKPASSQPRRFVHKFGLMIRPGVLKESTSKSKSESSRSRS